jgi:hypothetical protein
MASSSVPSGALSVARPSDEEIRELVGQLAEELESFAFERERVLAKLDIRAAGLARRIGRELRVVLRGLALATGDESREGVMATLGGLLVEAHRLLENVPASQVDVEDEPQESGARRSARPSTRCQRSRRARCPGWVRTTTRRRLISRTSPSRVAWCGSAAGTASSVADSGLSSRS